jgi:hypothetical protein
MFVVSAKRLLKTIKIDMDKLINNNFLDIIF